MDADIHAALFEGEDDEGEFEELQDDFITEVSHVDSTIPPVHCA